MFLGWFPHACVQLCSSGIKKKKTILICWHSVAFVLLAKFNTDEFWHTIKPAHVPDQCFGGGTSSWQSVMWWVPDGRDTGCSRVDLVNGSQERGPVSLLTHPLPYAWSCSAERYLGFCLDCQAPVGTQGSAQLHRVGAPWYLQVQLGWHLYTY